MRTSRNGRPGTGAGVLEDYADVAEGFLTLCGVTGAAGWLDLAGQLLDAALEHFTDGEGGFFDTADDAERLVRRPQDPTDNATPSGQSALAGALLSYAGYTDRRRTDAAERALHVTGALAAALGMPAGVWPWPRPCSTDRGRSPSSDGRATRARSRCTGRAVRHGTRVGARGR